MGQISDSTSSSSASTVSSLRTSEEVSHGNSSSDSRPAIGRGAAHGTRDRQDVGFVIRTRPESLTSKNGTEEGQKNTVTGNYSATISCENKNSVCGKNSFVLTLFITSIYLLLI